MLRKNFFFLVMINFVTGISPIKGQDVTNHFGAVGKSKLRPIQFQRKMIIDERPAPSQSLILGPVHISGSLGRVSGELLLSLEFTNIPIDGGLIERLASYCPQTGVEARQLSGTGKLRADLSFQPKSSRPWSYELHAQIANGKLRHARLPQPLENLEAKARCVDGQISVESVSAQSGATRPRSGWSSVGRESQTTSLRATG